jgi:hypothetical protein
LAIGNVLAERVGFEPTERFPAHSISSAANSTTLAPLQGNKEKGKSKKAKVRTAARPLTVAHEFCLSFSFYLFTFYFSKMAERVGFEPTVGVNPLRFSRPVH